MQPAVILWYLDTVSEDCNVVTYTKSNLRSVFLLGWKDCLNSFKTNGIEWEEFCRKYTKSSLKEKIYVITKFDVKNLLNQTKIKIKHKQSNRLHFCMHINII